MDGQLPQPSLGTPAADVAIDRALVGALLSEQHPDLAQLPLREVDAGWDNALFRLGDRLAVRLPRRAAAAALVAHEQQWLPRLEDQLALPIPVPVRRGVPAHGYPWRWSVVPWLPGITADLDEPRAPQAERLAEFLCSLHVPASADAPTNPYRGVPLRQRASAAHVRLRRLRGKTDLITPAITRIWQEALDAPLDVASTWLHGDLHPRNVLVEQGVISGIIDWGDLTAGDCATDLASIWMLFADGEARQAALAAYAKLSAATLQRAKGWAILFGSIFVDTGLVDNPRMVVIGARTLRRVVEPL